VTSLHPIYTIVKDRLGRVKKCNSFEGPAVCGKRKMCRVELRPEQNLLNIAEILQQKWILSRNYCNYLLPLQRHSWHVLRVRWRHPVFWFEWHFDYSNSTSLNASLPASESIFDTELSSTAARETGGAWMRAFWRRLYWTWPFTSAVSERRSGHCAMCIDHPRWQVELPWQTVAV